MIMACTPAPQMKPDGKRPYFTSIPSRLYFQNVRSAYYYRERQAGTALDIYTLRKAPRDLREPHFRAAIIDNWMEDEAYLFVRPNAYPAGFGDILSIRIMGRTETDTLRMPVPDKEAQMAFAGAIYQSLLEGAEIEVLTGKHDWKPILRDADERSSFLITVRDYYKLTDLAGESHSN